MGLYKSKVRLVYDALFRRYKAIDPSRLEMRNLIAHPEAPTTKQRRHPEAAMTIWMKLSSKLEPYYHIPDLTREGSIKNTYRFAFFWEPAKNPRNGACSWLLYIFGTMHHILNELWNCIDPGPVYTKTEFGLILRYCALNSTRFGVKNSHNTTRFAHPGLKFASLTPTVTPDVS